ncbi:hypothetical protein M0M57_01185 [Flavobacterium azooxidireducens]|uniref:Uncharacterized protein n=1 Tax=Flavobacterium azooxidireducens TaxID=1871076 RepID=A0ABY4KJ85_9FLAO|nr:hypothetical protein [Flavobacterium azooxidireducens]UPQ79465.1 hypothetical protein M0M57_01185 [Flavobacterium azooxidireducens]
MKTIYQQQSALKMVLCMLFLMATQITFSQKNNQKATINKGAAVAPKVTTTNCDCDKIDFKIRIIKLSEVKNVRTYRLQLIDFGNKNKCDIKFISLNFIGHQLVPMTSMRNQNVETASDNSYSLYEFDFDTKSNTIEPDDEAQIKATIQMKIGSKTCFIKNKQTTYYSRM